MLENVKAQLKHRRSNRFGRLRGPHQRRLITLSKMGLGLEISISEIFMLSNSLYASMHENYLDGGLMANNPTLDTLREIQDENS